MRIIGVCSVGKGSAGAGKSSVARRLVERHGFIEVAIADPLKRACMDIFGWTESQLWGPSESRSRDVRRSLLALGDCVNALAGDALTSKALDVCSALLNFGGTRYDRGFGLDVRAALDVSFSTPLRTGVVISDVRRRHEAASIADAGGVLFGVDYQDAKPLTGDLGEHPTECELVGFEPDCLLTGGVLEDLHRQVDEAVANWLPKGGA